MGAIIWLLVAVAFREGASLCLLLAVRVAIPLIILVLVRVTVFLVVIPLVLGTCLLVGSLRMGAERIGLALQAVRGRVAAVITDLIFLRSFLVV